MKIPTQAPFPRGFALIVCLSMMVLLMVLVTGLLSLSSIALRTSGASEAQAVARANARFAMMLAIGQLHKTAGPDQRVTGAATLGNSGSAKISHPGWTAVWESDDAGADPVYLVSGDKPDPASALSEEDSALLSRRAEGADTDSPANQDLRAAWVEVEGQKTMKGRYAYWIGDEGTKAKVDLTAPDAAPVHARERYTRSQSAQEPNLLTIDESVWGDFASGGDLDKRILASMGTAALAASESGNVTREELPRHYLHDLTTGGYGLPVNLRDGGMKADLSLVFDRSQQSKPFVAKVLGATPGAMSLPTSAKAYQFAVKDPEKYYLSDQVRDNLTAGVGPNWGTLFNYGRLWENISANRTPVVGIHPRLDTDLVQTQWTPYKNHNDGATYNSDTQHVNSGIYPVISVIQMGFMLGASGPIQFDAGDGKIEKRYQAELHVKPIIGMWNPYNVALRAASYKVEWSLSPYLRLGYEKPLPDGTFPTGSKDTTEVWLRDYWLAKSDGGIPSDSAKQAKSYLRLLTDPVDFQPGEFRLFSVSANPDIEYDNKLVPTLDPAGTFKIKLLRSQANGSNPADQVGQPLLIKENYYCWFGDVYLQDTHWDGATAGAGVEGGTRNHFQKTFGTSIDPNAASSWISLKTVNGGDNHLQRFTNIWNGGQDEKSRKPYLPEPIISARNRLTVGGASGKVPHRIEALAAGDRGAVGTWRFFLRNSTEVAEANQGLRGWIDSNPRVLASNLRFDGSKSSASRREGWNAASNLICGAHRTGAPAGDVGDGGGGDRGLVAEGAYSSNAIPQGIPTPGRWQGYGGPGSTANTGYTHVIAFDAPQAPLTSIGQFQHAQLARYNFEPGYVVGNSYANPRIPLKATVNPNLNGQGVEVVDISHEVNQKIWDGFFFSSLGLDYKGAGPSGSFDKKFNLDALASGAEPLPNPRMQFAPQRGDSSIDAIIEDAGDHAAQAMAARILINGGFNVNSTSKTAWKAVLSTMGSSELPVINPLNATAAASWERPEGVRFNRFGTAILNDSHKSGDGRNPAFWQGWRELSEDELDELAGEIVKEVRERGPFRSFAEFVNRNPHSPTSEHQRKGALQAALDRVANTASAIPSDIGLPANNPYGPGYSKPAAGESQAAGHAGYLLQGDLLQSLAPVLQARSDYFRVRTCGEALDPDGKVLSRAWCEAFVQRVPDYTDPSDKPELAPAELSSEVNRNFGRRFEIVSFRWLQRSEI